MKLGIARISEFHVSLHIVTRPSIFALFPYRQSYVWLRKNAYFYADWCKGGDFCGVETMIWASSRK